MAFKNLREFIQLLESKGELVRIKEYVNPHLEITEITDRVSKQQGPALLFENTGYPFPLLINAMGTEKRMAMALSVEKLDDIGEEIEQLFKNLSTPRQGLMDKLKLLPQLGEIGSWMPVTKSGRGACQEVIMQNPDITQFPVLTCWPEDGGPFITLPIIHTRDPLTQTRNVGLYRMQVFGPKLTAMHWHRHKVSARHFNEYKKLGKLMPVVVALGGDPVYTYAATAPLPDGVDEYLLAGFLRKKKVELVQCITQDAQVPADADIVIEGYIDPQEDFILEGPFGDHTGYYSLADYYPKFHITAITHRKDAVYPATIVGIPPQEDAWIGKATERIFLAPVKMTLGPEILDMNMPVEGVFHNLLVVKIKKEYPGQALKVMNALWGAGQMMFTKMIIIVDETVNIHNMLELAQYVSQNTHPTQDLVFSQGPVDVLDHSCSRMAFGGKMGIDATKKLPEELPKNGNNTHMPSVTSLNKEAIQELFSEVKDINDSLLSLGISAVFISVEKNKKYHIEELNKKLFALQEFSTVQFILYLEHTVDIKDIADAIWRFSNNIDPKRDHYPIRMDNGEHMGLDGTRKTKEFDDFDRDWPNILASDEKTIQRIDEIWPKLGLGDAYASPSIKYRKQLYKGGAVAE